MNRQEYWRRRYKRARPEWDPSPSIYQQLVDRRLRASSQVLDIGCGHTDLLGEIFSRARLVCGIDTDAAALVKNDIIRHRVVANAEELPFVDSSFDLVVMAWVLEHLEWPEVVFREIHRILRPGGSVIFMTPNAWNYNAWLIRLVPNMFHAFFTSRLYDRPAADTFPTRYRLNSVRRIESLLSRLGFRGEQLILNGDPTYVAVDGLLFSIACLVERLFDLSPLQRARVHIIGEYRRASGARSAWSGSSPRGHA